MISINSDKLLNDVRQACQGRKFLLIGDSIMRGMYKDLCCLLHGNSRLLQEKELLFNRHHVLANMLFGEKIEVFNINRTDSTLNQEKRACFNEDLHCHLHFNFTSRVWNSQIEKLIPSITRYDVIIFDSFIWDVTRYNDCDGKIYLENLDKCFSKLTVLNIPIIWVMLSPSTSTNSAFINQRLIEMNMAMIELMNKFSVHLFNMSDFMKSDCNTRHRDGIHFKPFGHRLISEQLIKFIVKLSADFGRVSRDQNPSLSNDNVHTSITASTVVQPNHQFHRIDRRRIYPPKKKSFKHRTMKSNSKIDYEASEAFGLAFGVAWRTFNNGQ